MHDVAGARSRSMSLASNVSSSMSATKGCMTAPLIAPENMAASIRPSRPASLSSTWVEALHKTLQRCVFGQQSDHDRIELQRPHQAAVANRRLDHTCRQRIARVGRRRVPRLLECGAQPAEFTLGDSEHNLLLGPELVVDSGFGGPDRISNQLQRRAADPVHGEQIQRRVEYARHIGAPDAKNRGLLLDAAEQLMLEQGYAAVMSRRLASRPGLKHRLVHCYFPIMEELFLEVFRRQAEEGLEVQAQSLQSDQPSWAVWRTGTDGDASRNRLLRRMFSHRTTASGGCRVAALRCGKQGRPTGGVDPTHDQLVGVSGARAGDRQVWRARRNRAAGRSYLRRLRGEPQPVAGVPTSSVVHQFRSEQSTPLGPSLDTTTAPSTAKSQ